MYVVIMSTEDAQWVTTQEQINQIVNAAQRQGLGDLDEYSAGAGYRNAGVTVEDVRIDGHSVDATVWQITSDAERWHNYRDVYTVPGGQYPHPVLLCPPGQPLRVILP